MWRYVRTMHALIRKIAKTLFEKPKYWHQWFRERTHSFHAWGAGMACKFRRSGRACGGPVSIAGAALIIALLSPAAAQDIRGLERCTSETNMERRTGCLQANIEFLHQALARLERDTREKINALGRDLVASRAEVATLRSTVEKLNGELMQFKAKEAAGSKKQ